MDDNLDLAEENVVLGDEEEEIAEENAVTYFTVTFDVKGGTKNGSTELYLQNVEQNKTAIKPEDPTRDHYTFGGWYADGATSAFDFSTPITAKTTLAAKWIPDKVNVTYMTLDEHNEHAVIYGGEPVKANYGEMLTAPEAPTRTSTVFGGWYTDEACTKKWYFSGDALPSGKEAYEYTLLAAGDTVKNSKGKTISVVAANPDDDQMLATVTVTDGQLGLTLYAKFTELCTVKFMDAERVNTLASFTAAKDTQIDVPTAPAIAGKTFLGWFDGTEADDEHPTIATTAKKYPVATDKEFFAKYKDTVYSITFMNTDLFTAATYEGASMTGAASYVASVKYGKKVSVPEVTLTGKKLEGWYTGYTNGQLSGKFDFDTVPTSDLTLYPNVITAFDVKLYRVFKELPTGVEDTSDPDGAPYDTLSVASGNAAEKPADPTIKDGTFTGWYEDPNGVTAYNWSTRIEANKKLYALFTYGANSTVEVTITYPKTSENVETGENPNVTATMTQVGETANYVATYNVVKGTKLAEPALKAWPGHTWKGWKNVATGEAFDFGATITTATNILAEWTEDVYTVTFVTNCNTPKTAVKKYYGEKLTEDDVKVLVFADLTETDPKVNAAGNGLNYTNTGWFTDSAFTAEKAATTATEIKANTTLYAKWEGIARTVNFWAKDADIDGGVAQKTIATVKYGDTVPASDAPTPGSVDGFTFVAWTYDGTDTAFGFGKDKITDEVVNLRATYAVTTYTVSFDTNGGSTIAPKSIKARGTVPALTAKEWPTKTGSAVEGFYTNAALTEPFHFAGDVDMMPTEDIVVNEGKTYYRWDDEAEEFIKVEEPDPEDLKKYYELVEVAGTPITKNMTVYVKWTVASYPVHYIIDGNEEWCDEEDYGTKLSSYENWYWKDGRVENRPYYDGDTRKWAYNTVMFDGWYSDSRCKTAYDLATPITGETYLYGKFDQAFNVIYWDGENGAYQWVYETVPEGVEPTEAEYNVARKDLEGYQQAAIQIVTLRAGETVTRPDDAPNKNGKAFTDWYQTPAPTSAKFTFGSRINAETVVYAHYEDATTYFAKFFTNDEEDDPVFFDDEATIGDAYGKIYVVKGNALAKPAVTRAGYELEWYECNSTGTAFANSVPFEFGKVLTGNVYLKAKYTAKTYTVKFETNGAGTVADQIVEYGRNPRVPSNLKKTGYQLDEPFAWYKDAEFKIPYNYEGITEDTTLYAKWVPSVYTVSFVDKNGNGSADQSVAYGKTVEKPADPTPEKTTQAFVAWYTDADFTTEYDFTAPVTKSFSLYAKYLTGVDIILNVADKAYDGTAIVATATATSKDRNIANPTAKLQYKVKGADDSTYSDTAPINVGTYVACAYTEATAKLAPAKVEKEFAITQVEATLVWPENTALPFTGAELAPIPTVKVGDKVVTDAVVIITGKQIKVSAVGTKYTATATLAADGNYKLASDAVTTCDFTIIENTTAPTDAEVKFDPTTGLPTTIILKNADGSITEIPAAGSDVFTIETKDNGDGTTTVTISPKAGSGYKFDPITKTVEQLLPAATKFTSITVGKKKATVKWKVIQNAEGYQIQYGLKKSEAAKMDPPKKFTGAKATIKKLKKGKKYYFRIRTYKTVNGKTEYSAWSKWKKSKKIK